MNDIITRYDIIDVASDMERDAVAGIMLPLVVETLGRQVWSAGSEIPGVAARYVSATERFLAGESVTDVPDEDWLASEDEAEEARWAYLSAAFLFDFVTRPVRSDLGLCVEALEMSVPESDRSALLARMYVQFAA